jgi:hypothetical protein
VIRADAIWIIAEWLLGTGTIVVVIVFVVRVTATNFAF